MATAPGAASMVVRNGRQAVQCAYVTCIALHFTDAPVPGQ